MRIGQVLHDDPLRPGGVQTHVRLLCEDLAARGHEVHAFAHIAGVAPGLPAAREDGWSFTARPRPGGTPFGDEALDARLAAEVVRFARARRLDAVHVHHLSGSGAALVPALRSAGFGVVATLHDFEHACARGQMWNEAGRCVELEPRRCADCMLAAWPAVAPPRKPDEALDARRRSVARSLHAAHALVAPSAAALRLVAARWPAPGTEPPRMVVVENGIRSARLRARVAQARPTARRGGGRIHLGFVGTLLASKGVLELAQAVKETGQDGLVLRIHGAAAADAASQALLRALEDLSASCPRIVLHGPFEPARLAQVLAGLDALAAPSLWDEFHGLALREGIAAGLWPVATDRGGLEEALDACPGAVRLPADRPQDWAWLLREACGRWRAPADLPLPREASQCARELEALYASALRQAESSASPALAQP